MSQEYLKVIGSNGKMLGGGAAQLSYIKQQGGWDEYNLKLVNKAAQKAYEEVIKDQQKAAFKIAK